MAGLISGGGTITNSSQFENIRTTGFYEVTITSGTFQISYGALLCFKLGSWYETIQIIFSHTEPKIIYRIAVNDRWSEWSEL